MRDYQISNRVKLFHSEEFEFEGVSFKLDVFKDEEPGVPFSFDVFVFDELIDSEKEEGEDLMKTWEHVLSSTWTNPDMDALFQHVVSTYGDELFQCLELPVIE